MDETGTPYEIAFRLLEAVSFCEGKSIKAGATQADRKYVLDTYAECLRAVKDPDLRIS